MGRLFLSYLDGRVYCCRLCKTHLARLDELISKVVFHSTIGTLDFTFDYQRLPGFRCFHLSHSIVDTERRISSTRSWTSFAVRLQILNSPLFPEIIRELSWNRALDTWKYITGPQENRKMTTGMHAVADIYCARCLRVVGWKYVSCTLQLIFVYDSVGRIWPWWSLLIRWKLLSRVKNTKRGNSY